MVEQILKRKIAYALVCYDAEHSGVFKKVLDQVTSWRSLGHSVQLFVITDKKSQRQWREIDLNCVVLVDTSLWAKIANRVKIISCALKSSPSLIYFRDSFPIRIPRSQIPIIIEIQSLVGQELRMRSASRYWVFAFLKKFTYRHIAGAVFVTGELMRINEFKFCPSIAKIVIGNAIDLGRIRVLPSSPNSSLALFFVGSPGQSWHGVPELVDFARLNSDIQVEIVGYSQDTDLPNVNFHGFLNPEDYMKVASKCIAGVGSLNLSTNQMSEASPLKVREYLALGLPVIVKYKDTDLDSEADYVLQIPCEGGPLSDFSLEIRKFLDGWLNRRVPRSQILNLDVSAKEKLRLRFFEEVISRHGHCKVKGEQK